ncbi:uncharacterized protein LOC62_05G007610 [Vanrija pseudolonga]|uniref:Uncharacterized protein n=1 Tax=Vanrija pseudolonga TaxID=143232 RepID=A0AAF1BKK8_9TREE|nr:hypothetical protein LOC62_05G007610 [Vanrija pseudolonga]
MESTRPHTHAIPHSFTLSRSSSSSSSTSSSSMGPCHRSTAYASSGDVRAALDHAAPSEKAFAYSVIFSYVAEGAARRRSREQVRGKLDALEQVMPHFAAAFDSVRAEFGLDAPSADARLARTDACKARDAADRARRSRSSSPAASPTTTPAAPWGSEYDASPAAPHSPRLWQ